MSENKLILVTGGAGYIGSHCLIELLKEGYEVLVADNGANSNPGKSYDNFFRYKIDFLTFNSSVECLRRVELIAGKKVPYLNLDVTNYESVDKLFKEHNFYAVLHLAALKAVGESMEKPLDYFQVNVGGTLNILRVKKHNLIEL